MNDTNVKTASGNCSENPTAVCWESCYREKLWLLNGAALIATPRHVDVYMCTESTFNKVTTLVCTMWPEFSLTTMPRNEEDTLVTCRLLFKMSSRIANSWCPCVRIWHFKSAYVRHETYNMEAQLSWDANQKSTQSNKKKRTHIQEQQVF